ncbi:serine threonine kinase [Chlorella sorokiniana]|uniref:Serine threonine kinase n=1 Tax=Chlorella sorokiniana TaxID=3076 RepID=A0A2P6TPG1_CHLSO|nr:serine threonine kinase [Chlorella sorokiniana]|eukprot:PRW55922.1 serine threonine kinase [Chlorella sorokiniana]
MSASPARSLEERVLEVVAAVPAGAPAPSASVPTSPTAVAFWDTLEGSAAPSEAPIRVPATRLPSLARSKSVCVGAVALQDALPQAKPTKLDRQTSKSFCTLPPLSRQMSSGGEEVPAAEPLSPSLTARCCAAARTWHSLQDFSSLRVVAHGGRSTVWEAVPKAPDQYDLPVALKAYSKAALGRTALHRLEVKQRILQTVRHPHIIKGFGAFEEDGHRFLVMEFAGGRSIAQFISYWQRRNAHDFEGGSTTTVVPEAEAAGLVLAPLLDALCCLHARGIVHRDIKPANAVFTCGGSIRLIDFSLSPHKSLDAEGPCCQIGTRHYMAPELFGHGAAPSLDLVDRTDCWAMGVMAFQLLTGEPPYSHDVPACLARLVLEEPVPLRMLRLMGASAPAVDFICAALHKDPAQWPTAVALRAHPWLVQHAGVASA